MWPFVFAILVGELLTSGKGAAPSSWLPRFLLAISQGWLQFVEISDRLGSLKVLKLIAFEFVDHLVMSIYM